MGAKRGNEGVDRHSESRLGKRSIALIGEWDGEKPEHMCRYTGKVHDPKTDYCDEDSASAIGLPFRGKGASVVNWQMI